MEPKTARKQTKPFRQNRKPVPFFRISRYDIASAAQCIMVRVGEILRARGSGAYLFIDNELGVYILPDTKTCAEEWVITYFTDLVGYYRLTSKKGLPLLKPTAEGIAEDIEDHLRGFA